MFLLAKKIRIPAAILALLSLAACSDNASITRAAGEKPRLNEKISLVVYKSRSCGCCKKWLGHLATRGFELDVRHPADLNKIKSERGISPRYQSCHTAVSTAGYIFEGHIPAAVIRRFLKNPPPGAMGLAVPGMPVGSPGMEMGNRFDAYNIWLLNHDGSEVIYEHIDVNS